MLEHTCATLGSGTRGELEDWFLKVKIMVRVLASLTAGWL